MIRLTDFWEASRLPIFFEKTDIRLDSEQVLRLKDKMVTEFEVDAKFNIRVWLADVSEKDF